MDLFRTAPNPWGEEVLLGLAWGLFWIAVLAGAVFIVVHAFFARRSKAPAVPVEADANAARIPARVQRHGKSARLSHWTLAASVLTLLITAFVPILGLGFPWVTIHWVAGLVLGAYVIYHTVDTLLARRSFLSMFWFQKGEIGESFSRLMSFFGLGKAPASRSGKWGVENKLFHHITALAGLTAVATGVLMMTRIDTWFWTADPYRFLTDAEWGIVFVVHGVSAIGFVGLLMAHIYFALRPDKFFFTKSMIFGWISRQDFLAHFDPKRWKVAPTVEPSREPAREPVAAGSGSAERGS